jgi:hypothetical protein
MGGRGPLTLLLFWLGLGGDGNVGAWWSGVLFLLAALFALDRAAEARRTASERRGWGALAAALAFLSFDEIASLHEFLTARGELYLAPMGVVGLGLVAYALARLRRAGAALGKLFLGFGLLATVPAQELVQHAVEWNNDWIYGARACLEEGTEIAGALALLAATSGGLLRIRVGRDTFASLVWLGRPLFWLAAVALPSSAAMAVYFNFPGMANWLAAALFLACALLAARGAAAQREPRVLWAMALYFFASLGANAVRPDWDPTVLGLHLNLRGFYFGALLLAAPWVLSTGEPWHRRAFWLALAGCTLAAALLPLRPYVVWTNWPPMIALLCFYVELSALMRLRAAPLAPLAADAGAAAVATAQRAPPRAGATVTPPV